MLELLLLIKVSFFKLIFYPRYKYYVWLKNTKVRKDWDTNKDAFHMYVDLVEPITTYRGVKFHLKYESFKSVCNRMLL